jgi:hypothetical protein
MPMCGLSDPHEDRAYQKILAAFDAAKLKRLVGRQVLVETEPGLFTLATAKPSAQPATRAPVSPPSPKRTKNREPSSEDR